MWVHARFGVCLNNAYELFTGRQYIRTDVKCIIRLTLYNHNQNRTGTEYTYRLSSELFTWKGLLQWYLWIEQRFLSVKPNAELFVTMCLYITVFCQRCILDYHIESIARLWNNQHWINLTGAYFPRVTTPFSLSFPESTMSFREPQRPRCQVVGSLWPPRQDPLLRRHSSASSNWAITHTW